MAAAAATGFIGGNGSSSSSWFQLRNGQRRKKKMVNRVIFCSASPSSSSVMDPYKTLRIQPGASESEIKKAFRQLALQVLFLGTFVHPIMVITLRSSSLIDFNFIFQYHPDVCRGSNCGVQFHQINEAYDVRTNPILRILLNLLCFLFLSLELLIRCEW